MKDKKIFILLFLLIIFIFFIFFLFLKKDEKNIFIRDGVFLASSQISLNEEKESAALFFLDSKTLDVERINLPSIPKEVDSFCEVRPVLIKNKYYLAVGSGVLNGVGKFFIFYKPNNSSWNDFRLIFEEDVDEFVRAVYVEDINNDNIPEIVIGTRPHGILKYYKLINGRWKGVEIDKLGATIHDLIVVDFNKNGKKEIIISTHLPNTYKENERFDLDLNWNYYPKIISYEYCQEEEKWTKKILWQSTKIVENKKREEGFLSYSHVRYMIYNDFTKNGENEIIAMMPETGKLNIFSWNNGDIKKEEIKNNLILNSEMLCNLINQKDKIIVSSLLKDALILKQYKESFWEEKLLIKKDGEEAITMMGAIDLKNKEDGIFYTTQKEKESFFYILSNGKNTNNWKEKMIFSEKSMQFPWGIFPSLP